MDFEKYSQTIKECLNLKASPVGVKLFENESEASEILEKTNLKIPHCQAIINASKGDSFYGTSSEIGCPIGSQILGLNEVRDEIKSGLRFEKMNVTSTQEAGKNLMDNTFFHEKIEAVGYAPLENIDFDPDVVVIIGKARQIFNIVRAHTYKCGNKLESSVSGTQSLCSDIVVKSIKTDSLNISYGCIGSHMATELGDNETVIGIPISKLDEICEALKITKIDKLSE